MTAPTALPSPAPRRALAAVCVAYAAALLVALATGWALHGHSPLLVAALADVAATLVVFGFSVLHDNSSVYDPYWSVAPIPIVAWWAGGAPSGPDARAIAVCVLVAVWGIRLTANWVARWRGLADEDFRYAEIRARTGRLYWPASLAAIHLLPTAWVFLGLLAAWPALASHGRPAGALDAVALAVTAGGIAVEAIADRQLRRFLRSRRDPSCVLETGLWRFSRHPNYFGEITFWWGLWLFGLAADPRWAWTAVGPVAITLLFALVSIPWMDRRMLSRHPAWAERMSSSSLLPWPRRRWIPLIVVAASALHAPDTAAEPGAPDLDALRRRYGGEYEFVGGSAERASVPAAVERSVQGMFFIARGIAYDRLLQSSQVCDHYTFDLGAGSISVAGSCRTPDVSPGDGREVEHRTRHGEISKVSQRFVGETLVQEFRGDEGARKVVWSLLPDGITLRCRAVISSKHLPRPVDYTLTYRRRSASSASADGGSGDAGR